MDYPNPTPNHMCLELHPEGGGGGQTAGSTRTTTRKGALIGQRMIKNALNGVRRPTRPHNVVMRGGGGGGTTHPQSKHNNLAWARVRLWHNTTVWTWSLLQFACNWVTAMGFDSQRAWGSGLYCRWKRTTWWMFHWTW